MATLILIGMALTAVCYFAWLDSRPTIRPDQIDKLNQLVTELAALNATLNRAHADTQPADTAGRDNTRQPA